MFRNCRHEIDRIDHGNSAGCCSSSFEDRGSLARTQYQAGRDLRADTTGETGAGSIIHGDGDDSAERAPEECRHPLGRVRAPQHDRIALAETTRLQFAGELVCRLRNSLVAPTLAAVASRKHVSAIVAPAIEIVQRVQQTYPHGFVGWQIIL